MIKKIYKGVIFENENVIIRTYGATAEVFIKPSADTRVKEIY